MFAYAKQACALIKSTQGETKLQSFSLLLEMVQLQNKFKVSGRSENLKIAQVLKTKHNGRFLIQSNIFALWSNIIYFWQMAMAIRTTSSLPVQMKSATRVPSTSPSQVQKRYMQSFSPLVFLWYSYLAFLLWMLWDTFRGLAAELVLNSLTGSTGWTLKERWNCLLPFLCKYIAFACCVLH